MTRLTTQLMTHLVLNYPNPKLFQKALDLMFAKNIDYLEIQIPFSHPLADGILIYEANQESLKYQFDLKNCLEKIANQKLSQKSQTKLILMSYLTPLLHFGFENLVNLLSQNGFFGLIIPDLVFGSKENQTLSNLCKNRNLQLIPVVSPLTSAIRIQKIISGLQPKQLVYATARAGQTGQNSNLETPKIQSYLDFLKKEFDSYQLAIGFGISQKSQVNFLNKQQIIAVIGSKIVEILNQENEEQKNADLKLLDSFLENLISV
jgi:tryptophan synthase alpha chain